MGVDMQIALGLNGEIDEAVLGKKRQHVVEKADAGLDRALARAVEVEGEGDVGFTRLPMDLRGAGHGNCMIAGERRLPKRSAAHARQDTYEYRSVRAGCSDDYRPQVGSKPATCPVSRSV